MENQEIDMLINSIVILIRTVLNLLNCYTMALARISKSVWLIVRGEELIVNSDTVNSKQSKKTAINKRKMEKKKKKKSIKRTLIEYGIIAIVALTLYATGLHTEVIGFVQRGILATGLVTPKIETVDQDANNEVTATSIPADFNLNLMDEDGKTISLEEFKGKVIFLNMWATWCPPCIAEMPNINKLYNEMGNDVAFVMVSLDEDFETAKAFNNRKGYNLPIYTLQSRRPAMYQSSTVPTTYVINAKGQLVLTHKGMSNYNTSKFKKFLKSLK